MFAAQPAEKVLLNQGIAPDAAEIEMESTVQVLRTLSSSGLHRPTDTFAGNHARHTQHLSHLLAEMQYLQRTYPNAKW